MTPATAMATRQRADRRARRRLPVSAASLSALSPAMSDCERLVGSPAPEPAAVLVTAKLVGPTVDGCAGSVFGRAETCASDAVESIVGARFGSCGPPGSPAIATTGGAATGAAADPSRA